MIIVKHQDQIEVFVNEGNSITIRQVCWPEDDSIIVFDFEHVESIIKELRKCKNELRDQKKDEAINGSR